MYCKKCGRENSSDAKFCQYCGAELEDEIKVEIVDGFEKKSEEAKCWSIFAQVGKILGIVSLATCWIPGLGMTAGIHGIVASALGRRSEKEVAKTDSVMGLKLAITGTALSFVLSIIYGIIIGIAGMR